MNTTTAIVESPGRVLTCLHCKHRWFTRIIGYDPTICPKCRLYWNVPKEILKLRRRKKK